MAVVNVVVYNKLLRLASPVWICYLIAVSWWFSWHLTLKSLTFEDNILLRVSIFHIIFLLNYVIVPLIYFPSWAYLVLSTFNSWHTWYDNVGHYACVFSNFCKITQLIIDFGLTLSIVTLLFRSLPLILH